MLSFKEYLQERVLSPGFNKEHDALKEKHRQEIHDILHKSYSHPSIGGYGGLTSGSKEESDAIHHDISNNKMKMVRRNNKVVAVNLYKDQHGRKSIAAGTDGTPEGKKGMLSIMHDDKKKERSWSEVSGAPEHIMTKMGFPKVPNSRAKELTGKHDIEPTKDDDHKYTRKIGNDRHEKTIMGYPKK